MSISNRYLQYQQDNLVTNPLSDYWKKFDCEIKLLFLAPCIYTGGMIGYAISLPFRILQIVKDTLFLLGSLLAAPCLGREPLQTYFFVFLFSLGSFGTALVGLVCPPLAYKIDEYIQSFQIVWENSIFCCSHDWEDYDNLSQNAMPASGLRDSKLPNDNELFDENAIYPDISTIVSRIEQDFSNDFDPNSGNFDLETQSMSLMQKKIASIKEFDYPVNEIQPESYKILPGTAMIFWIEKYCLGQPISFLNLFPNVGKDTIKTKFVECVSIWHQAMTTKEKKEQSLDKKNKIADYLIYKVASQEILFPPTEGIEAEKKKYQESKDSLDNHIKEISEGFSENLKKDLDQMVENLTCLSGFIFNGNAQKRLEQLVDIAINF